MKRMPFGDFLLSAAVLVVTTFVVASGECDYCHPTNTVACHTETVFSLCIDGKATRDYITCPENTICTKDAFVCYPKDEAVASCPRDAIIPDDKLDSLCGVCDFHNQVFSCIDETTVAFCFGADRPDYERLAICPENTVCDLENTKQFCTEKTKVQPSCRPSEELPNEEDDADDPQTTTDSSTEEATITEKGTTTTEESTTTITTEEPTTTTTTEETTTQEATTTTEELTTTTTQEPTTTTTKGTTTTEEITTEEATTTTEEKSTTTTESPTTTTTEESTTEEPTTTTTESSTTTTTTESPTTTTTEEPTTTTTEEPTTTTTEEPTTTTTEEPTTTTTEKPTTTTTTTALPRDPTAHCKEVGQIGKYKPDGDTTCTEYVLCYPSGDEMAGLLMHCDDGKYFNPTTSTCEGTRPDECQDLAPTETPTTTTAATTTTTAEPREPTAHCKEVGINGLYKPDGDTTCTKFVYCYKANGVMTGQSRECDECEYFNPITSVCQDTKPNECQKLAMCG